MFRVDCSVVEGRIKRSIFSSGAGAEAGVSSGSVFLRDLLVLLVLVLSGVLVGTAGLRLGSYIYINFSSWPADPCSWPADPCLTPLVTFYLIKYILQRVELRPKLAFSYMNLSLGITVMAYTL